MSETWKFSDRKELAVQSECFVTPAWAAEAIHDVEIMTDRVWDPCCGDGALSIPAVTRGYSVNACDRHDWGYGDFRDHDFLAITRADAWRETILMNPPFSLAVEFVEQSLRLGARKIVCFQRFAWRESAGRRDFWERHPPNRIYVCESRASCWRIDIPPEKRVGGTPTAHAWFVWERGQPPGTLIGSLRKPASDRSGDDA